MRHHQYLALLMAAIIVATMTATCKKKEDENTVPVVSATAVDTTPTGGTVATVTIVLNTPDRQFVIDAAAALLSEVMFARTADAQASNVAVKAFAHLLVQDLTRLNDEIRDLAAKRGVTLVTDVTAGQNTANENMKKKSGRDFDVTFLKQIADDNVAMIKLFEEEAKVVADEDLKNWVARARPILQSHADKAKEIQTRIAKEKY